MHVHMAGGHGGTTEGLVEEAGEGGGGARPGRQVSDSHSCILSSVFLLALPGPRTQLACCLDRFYSATNLCPHAAAANTTCAVRLPVPASAGR